MPFELRNGIRIYIFDSFRESGATQAIFTRNGGTSPEPWESLNVGATVGDDYQRVIQNRNLAFDALGRSTTTLYDVWQIHSADVVTTDRPKSENVPHKKADVILTDNPDVTLFMRFADCVPILLHDPIRKVVGIAHAGWRGTVQKTAQAAVLAMQTKYGSRPEDILAAIGPSICVEHYESGDEVAEQIKRAFGADSNSFLSSNNGVDRFDLWYANQYILEKAGLRNIEISGICTACHLKDWYSYRAENGRTGRFGALIAL
jgi:YfiH family protein